MILLDFGLVEGTSNTYFGHFKSVLYYSIVQVEQILDQSELYIVLNNQFWFLIAWYLIHFSHNLWVNFARRSFPPILYDFLKVHSAVYLFNVPSPYSRLYNHFLPLPFDLSVFSLLNVFAVSCTTLLN